MAPSVRFRRALAAALLGAAAARGAHAQSLAVRSARTDTIRTDAGEVVTAAFVVTGRSADSLRVTPAVAVPRGWTAILGSNPWVLAPGATESWLVSVSAPSTAAAGTYVIHAGLSSADGSSADSLFVIVSERRSLEVVPLEAPGWVLAGGRYEARFLVRNRGNVPASVVFTGTSSRGTRADAQPASAALAAGASTTVTVRVAVSAALARATDDVLELFATDRGASDVRASASARTTLVPRASAADALATVPAMLSVRSAGPAAGVSPVMIAGDGLLGDGRTAVNFSLQAPTGRQTAFSFGERDEYFVNLRGDRYALRLGDNVYGFSPLTSSGSLGTGAEFRNAGGPVTAGIYAQRGRWIPGASTEEAGFVGLSFDSAAALTAVLLERQSGGGGSVGVASLGGQLRLPGGATLQLETSASDSLRRAGTAQRVRLTGTAGGVTYDGGIVRGDPAFAGIVRDGYVADGVVSSRLGGEFSMTASGSLRSSGTPLPFAAPFRQRLSVFNLSASYGGRLTLEYGWLARHDEGNANPMDGSQHGLRASGSIPIGPLSVSGSVERGRAHDSASVRSRDYTLVALSVGVNLGSRGTVTLFGARNEGETITGAGNGFVNAGASAELRLPLSLTLMVGTSAQRATLGMLDGSGAWFSQSDARLEYRFASGSFIALRERIWQNPRMQGLRDAHAIYLEYRTPLRLPIGPSRRTGRATGRVVDAETGRPVAGAVVRMGDQAALSDKRGRVAFSGLNPERYVVSLDPSGTGAGALVTGDAVVDMREPSSRPAVFAVAVARGAHLRVLVRRMALAGGSLGGQADSLVSAGALPNVLLALEGARDTLLQATDDHGRLDFGSVPPGSWVVSVRPCDLPDHHVFETDRVVVTLAPGENREVELRVVPQRRAVTFIGDEREIKAKPMPGASPPTAPPPTPSPAAPPKAKRRTRDRR